MIKKHLAFFAEGAFGSRHLNLLNIHLGLVNFSQYFRLSLSAMYLLSAGYTLVQTLLFMGALVGLRFIARTPLMLIIQRKGTKPALIIGQIISIIAFVLFAQIKEVPAYFIPSLLLMGAGEALYWHAVHVAFATLASQGKFGRQLAARGIFMQIGGICAPLLTGFLQHNNQTDWTLMFALTTTAVLVSLVPLLMMPEPCPPRALELAKGLRVHKGGMQLFAGWGASSAVMAVIWPLVMFLQFGSISKTALTMTLTASISLFISIYVARRIDLGKGRHTVLLGAALYLCAVMALILFGHSPTMIAALSACINIAASAYSQPYSAGLYQLAQQTKDPLWFHYWSEMGWDLGNLTLLWGAALLLTLYPDMPLRWMMLGIIPSALWCLYVYFTRLTIQNPPRSN